MTSLPLPDIVHDVVVIGGGVVGCAVLRELARYELTLLLLEKESDLAEGVTKANSGVIHAGFNVPPGTLKAKTNVEGLGRIYRLAGELGVPHRKTGKLVLAFDDAGRPALEALKARGDRNGAPDLVLVGGAEIRSLEPFARGRWALFSPWTGIISPYEFTIALAENALQNGAAVSLDTPVTGVSPRSSGPFRLATPRGSVAARWVVNAAGLFADDVAALAGSATFRVAPCRGEYLVTDKSEAAPVRMPLYPVPPPEDSGGLGVHITPTLEGNLLLGPSSEFVPEKDDLASTRAVSDALRDEAARLMPEIGRLTVIHAYAGLRPKLRASGGQGTFGDFVIEESELRPRWIDLAGIESPGLTAAPAIAARVVEMIGAKENLKPKREFDASRPRPPRFAALDDAARGRLAAEDPDGSDMVCRCEHATRAEVRTALRNPFGARTLDAVKRRTRCGMGRCQGGFCGPRVIGLMEEEGLAPEEITKRGGESRLFTGRIKT